MKKIKNFFILLFLCVSIISFNKKIVDVNVYDEDPCITTSSLYPSYNQVYSNSYMKNYFSNLRLNMTKNFGGSCTFVALTSLLSYYDSYYNDSIIPDFFDQRSESTTLNNALLVSPGVKNISSSITNWKNGDETAGFLVNNMLNDFECNLMWTAFSNNIISSRWLAQLNFGEIQDVLDAYYGEGVVNCVSHTFNSNTLLSEKERVIKNYINQGIPCLVTITRPGGAHAVVAYDYDDDNIYANFGWKNSSSTTHGAMLDTYYGNFCYTNISYIMTLSFSDSLPLNSSSNYYVSTGSEKGYYVNNGATLNMHKHNISSTQLNNTHNYYCGDCSYSFEVEHDVTSYNIYNNLSHIENCSLCGSSVHEHIFKYTQYTTNYHKKVCELCGSSFNERHEFITYRLEKDEVSTNFNMCKYCAKVS